MAKGARGLYGKSPRIEQEPIAGEGDLNAGGSEQGAAAAAARPPRNEGTMNEGGNAEGDVMAGTGGIPTHHMHERHEMMGRHAHETMTMHHRHMHEHAMGSADGERHHKERQRLHTRHEQDWKELDERHAGGGEGPTGGMKEKPEGKGGTEPKA